MNNKLKKSFLMSSILVGSIIGAVASQDDNKADAARLVYPKDRMFKYYDGIAKTHLHDSLGPFTLNGEWVWCIEPWIYTQNGYNYREAGDIIDAGVAISRRAPGQAGDEISGPSRFVGALIPYILLQMPVENFEKVAQMAMDDQIADQYRDGVYRAAPMLKDLAIWIRQQPDYIRYSTIQMFYWQFVLDGQLQSPRAIEDGINSPAHGLSAAPHSMIQRVNDALALRGAPASVRNFNTDANGEWLMTRYHWALHWMNMGINNKYIEYLGGSTLYRADGTTNEQGTEPQRLVAGSSGRMRIKPRDAFVKVNKSMIRVNGVDNNHWNFNGIKVGVYEDRGGNQLHATITINGNGDSQPVKIKPNKDYYLYELDINNRPIMSSEQKINQQPMTGGKFEGQGGYGYALRIAAGQHTTADTAKVVGLENVPEIVNAKFKKVSNSTIDGQDNPQYSIAGAEYTLYASADDARAGRGALQTVRVNADGIGEFENLTRNVYYAKETKAPELATAAGNKKSHVLDDTVHTLDLRQGGTRDANVSTDATGANNPVHEFRYSEVYRSDEDVPVDEPRFDLRKVDKDTLRNLPQGFGNFANAEYKVEFFLPEVLGNAAFRNHEFTATYKTDDQGRINIYDKSTIVQGSVVNDIEMNSAYRQYERNNNWPVYDMRITEVNAPSGYHVSEEVKEIKATLTGDATIRQNNQQASLNEDDLELTLFKRQKVENEWQTNETEYIPGAKFLIENKTTGQRAEAIVDGQGKLKFNGLSEGNYELKEIEVPKGYQLNKQVIRFTVNKNAKISNVSRSIETDDDGNFRFEWAEGRVSPNTNVKEDIDILVDNIPTRATAKVVKVNEKNEPLAGATFTLTRLDDAGNPRTGEQPVEVTTNDQGVADFTGLVIGDYYTIEETKAPVGYKLPREKQVIKFRAESIPVKDSFAVTYEFSQLDQYDLSNRHVVKKNGKLTTAANSTSVTTKENTVNGMSFTVDGNEQMHLQFNQVNHTWKKLPATGSNLAMISGVVSMTLVFSGAVAYGVKRKLS